MAALSKMAALPYKVRQLWLSFLMICHKIGVSSFIEIIHLVTLYPFSNWREIFSSLLKTITNIIIGLVEAHN